MPPSAAWTDPRTGRCFFRASTVFGDRYTGELAAEVSEGDTQSNKKNMNPSTLTVTKVSILSVAFAILGALSVGYVAAQTASSTEAVETPAEASTTEATTPDETVAAEPAAEATQEGEVAGASDSAPEDTATSTDPAVPEEPQPTAPATTEATTPNPDDAAADPPPAAGEVLGESDIAVDATTTPEVVEPLEEAPLAINPKDMATAQSIATLEDAYFSEHESYLQILSGNQLPDYETGTVAEKLGQPIDPGARVDVYENVYGKGYQIFFEEDGVIYSAGYGPEALDRTFTYALPVLTASSTSLEI